MKLRLLVAQAEISSYQSVVSIQTIKELWFLFLVNQQLRPSQYTHQQFELHWIYKSHHAILHNRIQVCNASTNTHQMVQLAGWTSWLQ